MGANVHSRDGFVAGVRENLDYSYGGSREHSAEGTSASLPGKLVLIIIIMMMMMMMAR